MRSWLLVCGIEPVVPDRSASAPSHVVKLHRLSDKRRGYRDEHECKLDQATETTICDTPR
jgi:hypothetical protein